MQISEKGKGLIKDSEGCALKAYPDPGTGGKPWTIGHGHTHNVSKGDVITQAQAEQFLQDDLQPIYITIETCVKVPLNQNQFDALCSFIFNVGAGKFAKSTLLKKLNAGDYAGAAEEFLRWNKAAGRVLPGLDIRRSKERQLFLS